MDSPNDDARNDAQDLLRVYGTKPEAMFDQAAADLKNTDAGYRRWACDYISKQPVNEARQAEIARAWRRRSATAQPETRQAAAVALADLGDQGRRSRPDRGAGAGGHVRQRRPSSRASTPWPG